MSDRGLSYEFIKGVFEKNPIFVLVLGLCPTLAVTTSLENALGMAAATTFVLVGANLFVSLIRRHVPDSIRIPSFILIIATFVTIADLMMSAYTPALSKSLGIFVPLIVVNCIVLGRVEAFASRRPHVPSIADALGMGAGFALSLSVIGAVRELLGTGAITLLGETLLSAPIKPASVMILSPGAFLTIGMLLGLINNIKDRRGSR